MAKTEQTVYKVNYEATIEIAKQLRLRDIGGIYQSENQRRKLC